MTSSWRAGLTVYLDRRVAIVLFLGFTSGLPLLLTYSTLSLRLREADVPLAIIGLFSWASIAYVLKFLWSPLVDQAPLPFFTRCLGRRRGWLLASQLATAGTMVGLAFADPATNLWATAFWAGGLALASATQDIVIDAFRVESLEKSQLGAGAANVVLGYRLGMLAAGAGVLFLADAFGWTLAYLAMAAAMGVGMAAVLLAAEPIPPTAAGEPIAASVSSPSSPWLAKRFRARLEQAVIRPFADFMARPGWELILLVIAFYKFGEALLGIMANPFYEDMGFTKTEIAAVSKGWGFAMTIVGGYLGGALIVRFGILRTLLAGGVLQALSNLAFSAQALIGHSLPMLAFTIGVDNLTGGMANAALVAYLSSLCSVAYTATQYALLSSVTSLARTVFASGGGWLAATLGWPVYFLMTTVAALPGLLLLLKLTRRFPPANESG